jgi:hypothetical protein
VGISVEDWFARLREFNFQIWEIDEVSLCVRPLRQVGLDTVFSVNLILSRERPAALQELMLDGDA